MEHTYTRTRTFECFAIASSCVVVCPFLVPGSDPDMLQTAQRRANFVFTQSRWAGTDLAPGGTSLKARNQTENLDLISDR